MSARALQEAEDKSGSEKWRRRATVDSSWREGGVVCPFMQHSHFPAVKKTLLPSFAAT